MKTYRVIIFVSVLFCSCAPAGKSMLPLISRESYCSPPVVAGTWRMRISMNGDSVLQSYADLRKKFSDQTVLMSYAMDLCAVIGDSDVDRRARRINSAVWLANSEIDALAAELDCEGERINQIAAYVDNINSNRVKKFTVASIVVGAAAGVAGAFIDDKGWNRSVAVGAGVAAVGLGLATLNPRGKKVQLSHKRNLLLDIWSGQNCDSLSPFIWFVLNERRFSNAGSSSLRVNTRQRWIDYQFDGNEMKGAASINFSAGGFYSADDLHERSQMINQLQAVVRTIKQLLHSFLVEVEAQRDMGVSLPGERAGIGN